MIEILLSFYIRSSWQYMTIKIVCYKTANELIIWITRNVSVEINHELSQLRKGIEA